MDDVASGGNLEWQDSQPTDGVFPSASETERGIDETANVHGEGTVDGVQDGHLGESLHHEVGRETWGYWSVEDHTARPSSPTHR